MPFVIYKGKYMTRVEDKYIISNTGAKILAGRLAEIMEPDPMEKDENGYSISSLYFDDVFDTHLRDTVEGNPIRKKFRIRIYNNSFDTIKLEVKHKIYNRTLKVADIITREEMLSLMDGDPVREDSHNPAVTDFNLNILNSALKPKVIVTYLRKAFVFDPGNVRITFDSEIRGSKETEMFGASGLMYDNTESRIIMEIKYDEFLPDCVSRLMNTGNMQRIAFSKYRICREMFETGIKCERE